jgi:RND family efflux transporter MFP subunit
MFLLIIIAGIKIKNQTGQPAVSLEEDSVFVRPPVYPCLRRFAVRSVLLPVLLSAGLLACSKQEPAPADVRPVRAVTLSAASVGASAEFSGDVRARYESRLGFRVGGKISARKVDVGTVVKRGTLLMQLDPQDLRLGQAQAQANLRAAQTNYDLARAELKRYQDLRAQNFVSQAVLDQKLAAARSSQATVEAARAALSEQANQTGYASLVSDTDGVVTGIDAEVGQVVQAGTPVVRVARTDEKEVVIGVPEDQVDELRHVTEVKVRLWADPNQSIPGKIREVSPVADPATRTYTVKVSVPAREDVRLGMTAAVQIVRQVDAKAGGQLRVPLSALYQDKGATAVWVVENGAVKLTPVQLGGVSGNEVLLAGGVQAGQTVVTAGVNQLKNGQKVRILTADVARRADAEAQASGAQGAAAEAPPSNPAPSGSVPPGGGPSASADKGAAGAAGVAVAAAGAAKAAAAPAGEDAARKTDASSSKEKDKKATKQDTKQAAKKPGKHEKQAKKAADRRSGKAEAHRRRHGQKHAAASTGAAR